MQQIDLEENFKNEIDSIWDNPRFENIEIKNRGYAIQKININMVCYL